MNVSNQKSIFPAPAACPRPIRAETPVERSDAEDRLDAILRGLTLDEKLGLVAGSDAWQITAVPRAGIPAIKVTDGPNGARGAGNSGSTSACFPCGTARVGSRRSAHRPSRGPLPVGGVLVR